MFVLVAIAMAGVLLVFYRLAFGLGPVSAMNDGYAWGIWKPLNVVTFTGIAAGAYGLGLLVYAFNRGEYHPLVRSAIMAGTMGYTLAGTSVLVDLGGNDVYDVPDLSVGAAVLGIGLAYDLGGNDVFRGKSLCFGASV